MHSDILSQCSTERSMQWPHEAAVMFYNESRHRVQLFLSCMSFVVLPAKQGRRDLPVQTTAYLACILQGA